jgi:hypothetical protein
VTGAPALYNPDVPLEELSEQERAEVEADEALWRKAHAIVGRHPGLDVTGVHHTLVNLRRTPAERLARSLGLGRAYRAAVAAARERPAAT